MKTDVKIGAFSFGSKQPLKKLKTADGFAPANQSTPAADDAQSMDLSSTWIAPR